MISDFFEFWQFTSSVFQTLALQRHSLSKGGVLHGIVLIKLYWFVRYKRNHPLTDHCGNYQGRRHESCRRNSKFQQQKNLTSSKWQKKILVHVHCSDETCVRVAKALKRRSAKEIFTATDDRKMNLGLGPSWSVTTGDPEFPDGYGWRLPEEEKHEEKRAINSNWLLHWLIEDDELQICVVYNIPSMSKILFQNTCTWRRWSTFTQNKIVTMVPSRSGVEVARHAGWATSSQYTVV